MYLAFAKKILADGRLDAELARREERRWLAEDDSGLTALVGHLGRLLSELERPMRAGQVQCEDGRSFDDLVAALDALIEKNEALAAREEDEAAGIEHRVRLATLVRPQHKREQPPSSPVRTLLPTCR
jgi:hypothetical protein